MIRSPARAPRPRVCAHVMCPVCVPGSRHPAPPAPRCLFIRYRFEKKHQGVQGGCPPKSIHKQQSSQDPVRACVLSVVEILWT